MEFGPNYLNFAICTNQNIQGLISCGIVILMKLIPMTAFFALLLFLWGVSKILRGQGDMKAIEEGRRTAFWGIIALFIIVSIGGLVVLLQQDFLGGVSNSLPTYR